ncbi:hypothetical protein YZ50_00805 [Campylobacter upsaliensis]|nr:hypothetical protein [Campylobacter upsaliensis]
MTYTLFIKVINEKTGREKMIDTKAYCLADIQKIIEVLRQAAGSLRLLALRISAQKKVRFNETILPKPNLGKEAFSRVL